MTNVTQYKIAERFLGHIRFSEPLSRHTSWHVGGPADVFYEPKSGSELADFLKELPADVPCHVIGLGSNTLVRDGGVRGVVVSLQQSLDRLEWLGGNRIHADAGVACARVARQCAKWRLGPAEFFAGIPGTVGGALAMNAGAWGADTWSCVSEVDVIDRTGACRTRKVSEYRWGYRQVDPPAVGEWFTAARFEFTDVTDSAAEKIKNLLAQRRETQPIGDWSGGSTFTNPSGDHAARLIESAGLKGVRQGGAVVSEKHANFILNEGTATAKDIEVLITYVRSEVQRVHGVNLQTEVLIVGEDRA
jgi:UDP-N-acetylmuramate dehydrogenase